MPVVGLDYDSTNPSFTKEDLLVFIPNLTAFFNTTQGETTFTNLYEIANGKIFYSVFGSDWKMAMSWCIAHYLFLIVSRASGKTGTTLEELIGGGDLQSMITSASVGGFNVSYNTQATVLSSDNAKFWNLTSYGAQLFALWKTKNVPQIMVATPPTNVNLNNSGKEENRRLSLFELNTYNAVIERITNLENKVVQLQFEIDKLKGEN